MTSTKLNEELSNAEKVKSQEAEWWPIKILREFELM
jgi:hypothetical protein